MLTFKEYTQNLSEDLAKDNIDKVKATYDVNNPISTVHDPNAIHTDSNKIIDHLAKADPTRDKEHVGWITHLYHNGFINQSQTSEVKNTLKSFERYKHVIGSDHDVMHQLGLHPSGDDMSDIHNYHTLEQVQRTLGGYVNYDNTAHPDIGIGKQDLLYAQHKNFWTPAHSNAVANKIINHVNSFGDFYGGHKRTLEHLGVFNERADEYKKALSNHLRDSLASGRFSRHEILKAKNPKFSYWNEKIHGKAARDGLSKRLRSGVINPSEISDAQMFKYWDDDRHSNDISFGYMNKINPPKQKTKINPRKYGMKLITILRKINKMATFGSKSKYK